MFSPVITEASGDYWSPKLVSRWIFWGGFCIQSAFVAGWKTSPISSLSPGLSTKGHLKKRCVLKCIQALKWPASVMTSVSTFPVQIVS